jgi:hypothetical protein
MRVSPTTRWLEATRPDRARAVVVRVAPIVGADAERVPLDPGAGHWRFRQRRTWEPRVLALSKLWLAVRQLSMGE